MHQPDGEHWISLQCECGHESQSMVGEWPASCFLDWSIHNWVLDRLTCSQCSRRGRPAEIRLGWTHLERTTDTCVMCNLYTPASSADLIAQAFPSDLINLTGNEPWAENTYPNQIAPIHPKAMPVILADPGDLEAWLGGAPAVDMQKPFPAERMALTVTE
ncbi:hypothetical protein [Halovulum sp. GXIMD14793]